MGYICQLLAQGPWLRMPSRITAPCSFGQNAIHAATSWGRAWFPGTHQDGTLGGLDAVSWCLELDDTLRRSEGCGCSGPSSPSSNPIITGQKSFLGCHSSLFPFCFSLHTSLLICFFGSGESSGGRAEGAKESQARGFCVPQRQRSADPLSGVIWSGLLSEGKSDPSLGISTLLRCPADGQGPGSTSAGDGDLPLMSPLEPESSSSGKGGGWSPVLGQAGF